ncbi:hypothetical protein V6Z12_D11G244200 [Gossypium hirsutum]|uniref:Fra a 1-associated protein-like isoform X2 n=1 Tax=Gossypium hirsutum TaxID=3635 RepID=A0A1U8MQ14_GOSHI|nr:fra a 1-associated protein-like isoform X2 [Gossypium hirsutum]
MGWVWKDDPNDAVKSATLDGDHCSTRKVIQSKCKNEEVEPGKFIRKCEKTEEVLRECVGSCDRNGTLTSAASLIGSSSDSTASSGSGSFSTSWGFS